MMTLLRSPNLPLPGADIAIQWQATRIRMGAEMLSLDHGGVLVAVWVDEAFMVSDIQALGHRTDITVRLVSGALIADLTLEENLTLEAALCDGSLPRHLIPEIDSLFDNAACPVDWPAWVSMFPDTATPDAMMHAKVGRALMADPDVLVIDAAQWNDALISFQRFSRSFALQYPWRTLVWATCDLNQASSLRAALKEFEA